MNKDDNKQKLRTKIITPERIRAKNKKELSESLEKSEKKQDLKAKLLSLLKNTFYGIFTIVAYILESLFELVDNLVGAIGAIIVIVFLFLIFSDFQEEAVGKNTLELLNDRCGDVLEVENVTMPTLAFFEKAFEARVFLKNKNNPDVAIPISVYVTAEGEIWGTSFFSQNAYYEISGLETLKLIPLGCGF